MLPRYVMYSRNARYKSFSSKLIGAIFLIYLLVHTQSITIPTTPN